MAGISDFLGFVKASTGPMINDTIVRPTGAALIGGGGGGNASGQIIEIPTFTAQTVAHKEEVVAPIGPPMAPPIPVWSQVTENEAGMDEYAKIAAEIGVDVPELAIEEFKRFLTKHDLSVYSLKEVVAYMDDKSARESKERAGWHWCPLRAKDAKHEMVFGRRAVDQSTSTNDRRIVPASDAYANVMSWMGQVIHASPYRHVVPLHALKRVALIEREFKRPVAFLVSDYAPAPQFKADPFLMAVIPNPRVGEGIGRFCIDMWDEPGFGLDRMLK